MNKIEKDLILIRERLPEVFRHLVGLIKAILKIIND